MEAPPVNMRINAAIFIIKEGFIGCLKRGLFPLNRAGTVANFFGALTTCGAIGFVLTVPKFTECIIFG